MQLIYRGVSYESNPVYLEMIDTGIMAKYRGKAYAVRSPRFPQSEPSSVKLTYRGVSYSPPQALDTEPKAMSRLTLEGANRFKPLQMSYSNHCR